MRFHVLGLGPLGSLLAYNLRITLPEGHSVLRLHKTTRFAAKARAFDTTYERNGVIVPAKGIESEWMWTPDAFNTHTVSATIGENRAQSRVPSSFPIDSLFVSTKAHQTLPAIKLLLPRLSANSTIVLLHNSLGVYEELVGKCFVEEKKRPHFILALNTHKAWQKRLYNVVHTWSGKIVFGIVPDPGGRGFEVSQSDTDSPALQGLNLDNITTGQDDPEFPRYRSLRSTVAVLSSMQMLNTSWVTASHVQTILRKRLVADAIIQPLAAIMGCRSADLFKSTAAHRIVRRVCTEAAKAYTAQAVAATQQWLDQQTKKDQDSKKERQDGEEQLDVEEGQLDVEQEQLDDEPEQKQFAVGRIPKALSVYTMEKEVFRVAELAKNSTPPMLLDIRNGHATEIEYLNGYLLGLGSRYGVPMPATATLLNLIKMRSGIPLDQTV